MQVVPTDLIRTICDFLDCYDLYMKIPVSFLSMEKRMEFRKKLSLLYQIFPVSLIELFKIQNLFLADWIEWNDLFIGNTDYIDKIKSHHLKNKISIGRDPYHRTFISLKIMNHTRSKIYVLTLFQRFSDQLGTWTIGCHSYDHFMKHSGYFLQSNKIKHPGFIQQIESLLSFQKVWLLMPNEREYDLFELIR